jgi:hypothetical protein
VDRYYPFPLKGFAANHRMFQVYFVNLPWIGIGPHTSVSWLP